MVRLNSFFNRILLANTVFLLLFLIAANRLGAQDNQKSKVNLSEQEWKAVEGIFQSPQNSDMNVQFTARDNMLVAKLLWNNNELHLSPESSLVFYSNQEGKQEPVRITFIKDSSGAINQVNVANNGLWKRNNNYKPFVRKEIEHTPDQLKQFEGLFQLQNDATRFIQFSVKDNNLVLKQGWDGETRSFVPESAMDFFVKDFPLFTLNFSKDKVGNINQVVAFKKDVWIKVKKASLSAGQLKSYEGKFRSNDDPDNVVELMVVNDHLVLKQMWDKKEIILEPKADTYFYNEAESYPVVVMKNKDGVVNQITILGTSVFSKIN
jgi:hypothetical protein